MTTLAFLVLGFLAGLKYFHVDIARDTRAIAAGEFGDHHRAIRAKADLGECNVRLCAIVTITDQLILGTWNLQYLDFGSWLPPNWERQPTCVHASHRAQRLLPMIKTAFPPHAWKEFFDPAGHPAGWSYHTSGLTLRGPEVRKQWTMQGFVSGSLILPQAGTLEVACPGTRFNYRSPIAPGSLEGHGTLPVVRGLTEVTIEPLQKSSPLPPPLQMEFRPVSGPPVGFRLAPEDLYAVPVYGWVKRVRESPLTDPNQPERVEMAIVPTVWSSGTSEETPRRAGFERTTTFSAIPSLPPGMHNFQIVTWEPTALRVTIGEKEILSFEQTGKRTENPFILDAREVNGKLLQVARIDTNKQEISVVILNQNGEWNVPPYTWFVPTAPERF